MKWNWNVVYVYEMTNDTWPFSNNFNDDIIHYTQRPLVAYFKSYHLYEIKTTAQKKPPQNSLFIKIHIHLKDRY